MYKTRTCDEIMTKVLFCQISIIVTAICLALGSPHEVKSSYYLISTSATERCELKEVNNILDEQGCLSLCNRDNGCTDVVYKTGSCLMKLDRKRRTNEKAVELWKGENIAIFKKLGRNFDFMSRKFQESLPGKGCGFHDELEGENQMITPPRSCKEIYESKRLAANGNYSVWPNGINDQEENFYCHMTKISGCGEGGWTLVMKIDGSKATFFYSSDKWTSTKAYNPTSAPNGLDLTEMVSPAYWTTPLTKLCLGMSKHTEMNWILVPVAPAQSLHSLIASNVFTSTYIGPDKWKSLLSNSYLQSGCEKEGFNAYIQNQKVRIGMVAGTGCLASDSSLIGFGTTTFVMSGNYKSGSFHGKKRMSSFGYILVQ